MSLSASMPVNSAATPTGVSADANLNVTPEGGLSVFDVILKQMAAETPVEPEAIAAPVAEAPVVTADVTAAVLADGLTIGLPEVDSDTNENVQAEEAEGDVEARASAEAAQMTMVITTPAAQSQAQTQAKPAAADVPQPAIAVDAKATKTRPEKTFAVPAVDPKGAESADADDAGSADLMEAPVKEAAQPFIALTKADPKEALSRVRDAVTGTEPQTAQTATDPRTVSAAAPDASASVTPSAFSLQAISDTSSSYNAAGASTTAASNLSKAAVESLSALSMQISKKLEQGSTKFAIELYPADLGKVEVSLHIARDGKTTAHLTFDSPVTAASFSASEPELRQQLADAGVSVDSDALSFSSRDGGSSFGSALAQDQQQQSQARNAARALKAANKVADDSDLNAALTTAMNAMRSGASTLALNLIV